MRCFKCAMIVNNIQLEGYRNYINQRVDFNPGINVISGQNAQGKTNLLEAIAYLSTARSFRAGKTEELIGYDQDAAYITANVFSRGRDIELEARLFRGGIRRRLLVGGVLQKNADELFGALNTVLFCPEDLSLIRDSSAVRRRFMDIALSQLSPSYVAAISAYNRALQHKNRILKDSDKKPSLLKALDDFNEQMAVLGSQLINLRARFISRLSELAAITHSDCSGGLERLSLIYETVSTVKDAFAPRESIYGWLREHQESHRTAEIESRSCLSGPHKDNFTAYIGGKAVKNFGSQGQTRTAALSIKLAEREIHRDDLGEYPVLLLDDVLSELDSRRQDFVLSRIQGGQVIISCCENERLEQYAEGRIIEVKDGRVIVINN